MADKAQTTEVKEQKLDDGYSQPSDSREATHEEPKLNTPGADFSHLKDATGANDPQPLDNTPAGKAMGYSDGRPMSQPEAVEKDNSGGK